jgi:hypothetical protein
MRFKTTAFGLTNAPATQQRLVDQLFSDMEFKTFAYLDDIIVISSTFEEHVSRPGTGKPLFTLNPIHLVTISIWLPFEKITF